MKEDSSTEINWPRTYAIVFGLGIAFILIFWWFTATYNLP